MALLSEATHFGNLYYLSGQIGRLPGSSEFAGEDIASQAEQAAKNIEAVLQANGMGLENIIKANCYLTSMDNYGPFNEVYARYFTSAPSRTCVAVRELPFNALCEIEVVAVKP